MNAVYAVPVNSRHRAIQLIDTDDTFPMHVTLEAVKQLVIDGK